jgi:beta-aspartyl-dipeptidase (metallo-type)
MANFDEASLTLLTNLELFAPEPLGKRHLLVAGGRILWIGDRLPALDPALGAAVRDLDGCRVIPGLIDAHVHLTGGGGEAGFETRVPPVPLSRFTLGGITTVVGVLGTDDLTRSPAELVVTARGLSALGLTAFCHTGGYHLPPATVTGSVRGDIVHLDPVLGVGELALSDHRSSQPTLDQLLQVAAEAHVAGLMTGKAGLVHLHLGDGPRGLELVRRAVTESELPPRVFHPTHVNRRRELFEEALQLVSLGVTIDVTAFPVGPDDDAWSAAESLVRFWEAGLPRERVTVSSDGGGCLPVFDGDGRVTAMDVGDPGALAQTLQELLGRGLDLGQILPPFTVNAARVLRLERKGRIAVGGDADLLVLDHEGRIRDVMANGRWHVENGAAVIRGTFEEAGR